MQKTVRAILIVFLVIAACTRLPDPGLVENPRVVILMYHRITEGDAGNLYERSAEEFERDLLYLRENNIRVIDFNELEAFVSGEQELTTNAAVITFDDGDHSWYTLAAPLLKRYRMKATFFLWASKVDMDSFLGWEEVERLSCYTLDGGVRPFSFGSHTMSHQYLMSMKSAFGGGEAFQAYLDEELGGSKVLIDRHIYGSVEALALPYGDGSGDEDIIAGARRHGYSFIRTSERDVTGITDADLFRLPSLPMLDDTDQELIGTYLGIH
jgi:peptidoglycan/xylan/chitin deacetylase (PgdA/CDA1 family)